MLNPFEVTTFPKIEFVSTFPLTVTFDISLVDIS